MRGCSFCIAALLTLAPAASAQPAPGPSDPREVEAFFDGAVPALLEAYHVPGLVLSVVRDGQVLLAKGWGVADVETGRPMDGERTIVRVASISKLVTATARRCSWWRRASSTCKPT